RLHDGRRVLLEPVVDRTGRARARAFVVDAEPAADVHVADRQAELAQLDEIPRRLAHAGGDVADVRNLRAHEHVQQLQRFTQVRRVQLVDQRQQLARRQTEL